VTQGDHEAPTRLTPDPGVLVEQSAVPTTRRRLLLDLTPLRVSRDFRLLWTGQFVSLFGSMMSYVAVPYQVAQLTHSPFVVGLLGLAEIGPLLLTAFVGGALADYVDRRLLVRLSEAAFVVVVTVLLVNAAVPHPRVSVLFVAAGLLAAIDGIQRPALDSLTPRLVPPDLIPSASALSTLRMTASAVIGPAVGGILVTSVSLSAAYAVDVATFLFSLMLLAMMHAVPPPPDPLRPSLRSVGEGLRYAGSRPELLGTYLVDINAMFFGMPIALFPFVAQRLGGGHALGLLYAAPAVGSLVATATSGWARRVHRHGLMVVVAACGWGAAITVFGLVDNLWLALFFLALAGAADMISGVFRGTIWDQTIPDHLRGRLAAIEMLSYSTGPALGNVESGFVARLASIRVSIVSGGLVSVAGSLVIAAAMPAFIRYDGRDGLAKKQAIDAARASAARASEAS
jgi:MFS family permease